MVRCKNCGREIESVRRSANDLEWWMIPAGTEKLRPDDTLWCSTGRRAGEKFHQPEDIFISVVREAVNG